jgi:hypothetical protein
VVSNKQIIQCISRAFIAIAAEDFATTEKQSMKKLCASIIQRKLLKQNQSPISAVNQHVKSQSRYNTKK